MNVEDTQHLLIFMASTHEFYPYCIEQYIFRSAIQPLHRGEDAAIVTGPGSVARTALHFACIGFCLVAGLFSKTSTIAGMILLFLYYISNPPFIGFTSLMPSEGNYLIINKTLIEIVALFVLTVFPTGRYIGFDLYIHKLSQRRKAA